MTQEPFEKRVALGGKGGASAPPMRSQRLAALAAEATCSPRALASASGAEAPFRRMGARRRVPPCGTRPSLRIGRRT